MKKSIYVSIIVLVLLAAGYAAFYYYGLNKGKTNAMKEIR